MTIVKSRCALVIVGIEGRLLDAQVIFDGLLLLDADDLLQVKGGLSVVLPTVHTPALVLLLHALMLAVPVRAAARTVTGLILFHLFSV